ncbi:putative protein N(5)-glutamine methyltransferase [Antrihabitans sp. YC2-6]|uniref:putative protein N(5)-glutamine methyltransferase n=1 Tax=Antrihabitans sp. YC2-6 TaxID=2799498 RepID=UPI0018F5C884|nr:putative protein N(5)-glutamine methyltransferase [Antrihabitans sp. YC2-6]MBJ8345430.1 putative protein N(5)-glutamine methyltransferase [Antrihabitans sp. YC2-6]
MSTDSVAPVSGVVATLRAAGCVFAEDEARLLLAAAQSRVQLDAMVERRAAGLPLEHILGWAEFCGLRVSVDPRVFVPRRRTEFLIEQAVASSPHNPVVVDLCCGAGALGLAFASRVPSCRVYAADIDAAAVQCARRNLVPLGAAVYEGDLYEPLPDSLLGTVDVLLVNAPYVPSCEIAMMPPEARLHENSVALDGGADGLDVLRRVIADAPDWLAPGGRLFFETGEAQAAAAVHILDAAGLTAQVVADDDGGANVLVGTRQPSTLST